jgi:hypothetical protein
LSVRGCVSDRRRIEDATAAALFLLLDGRVEGEADAPWERISGVLRESFEKSGATPTKWLKG